MSSATVLERYVKPREQSAAHGPETPEGPEDLGAFGWLRGAHERAVMLELRRKDGSTTAFAYAWLERVDFDPSEGIMLKFGRTTVKIIGRNLNAEHRSSVRISQALVRQRVPWIQEMDGAQTAI